MQKKNIIRIIAIVIVLALIAGVYGLWYLPKEKRAQEIKDYKKGLYESILCEYNCPLKMQDYHNKTQLLPEAKCVKNCNKDFVKVQNSSNFTKEELNKDLLIKEMSNLAIECKQKNTNIKNSEINNSGFFACYAEIIKDLKDKYGYLKDVEIKEMNNSITNSSVVNNTN